jgi:hypothetical protein
MQEFFGVAAFVSLLVKGQDVIGQVTDRKYKSAAKQVLAWALGVGLAFLFANTSVENLPGGSFLDGLDGWELVVVGLGVSSGGSLANDFRDRFARRTSTPVVPLESSPGMIVAPLPVDASTASVVEPLTPGY